jgi:hypothetical protein
LKSKYPAKEYETWIHNMLKNVNNYNLVIYSDEASSGIFKSYLKNSRIKLVLKPMEEFYNYKYKSEWERNQVMNKTMIQVGVSWEVVMMWCEKVHFVKQTIENKYFTSDLYGWCDIGYFRGRPYKDLTMQQLKNWPNPNKLREFSPEKIHYGRPANDIKYLSALWNLIRDKNEQGLPKHQIPPQQVSIAGGFFIIHESKIDWWREKFDAKLRLYFENKYLVKDDQMIIADCIFSDDDNNFWIYAEKRPPLDCWFMFQRLLL